MKYFILPIVILSLIGFTDTAAFAKDKVSVSSKDCKRLARKGTDGAGYKAGVDARGKKVRGADLGGGSPIKLPRVLSFDINADMSKYMSDSAKEKLGDAESKVGTVKFDINSGAMTFNGKPLTGRDQAELRARCKRALQGR